MSDDEATVRLLREAVATFVRERDWEQFHTAKELATAISIEAAELMELFLWMEPSQVQQAVAQPDTRKRVEDELADVVILCLSLANHLQIGFAAAVLAKVNANAQKYPAAMVRGSAKKYTQYQR